MAHYNRVMNSKHGDFTAQRKPDVVMAFDEITMKLYKRDVYTPNGDHLKGLPTEPLQWVDCMSVLEFKRTSSCLKLPRAWKGDITESLTQGACIKEEDLSDQVTQALAAEKVEADKEDKEYESKKGEALNVDNHDSSTPGE